MIKNLINIFYIKYIMKDIYTFDDEVGKENNFVRWPVNTWFNPKYLYENKYMLHLRLRSRDGIGPDVYLLDSFVYYQNVYNHHKYYYVESDTNLTFDHFPDDLNIAIVCSFFKLERYDNFSKYFKNFTYKLCFLNAHGDYLYLIKRQEEFKSII